MSPHPADRDFQRCVDFHGHECPGLAIGYRAAKAAMERLEQGRSADEELVAIVETDACGADAVQVLTGCTFGKGNFFFKDYGKHAFTLTSRKSGRGFRVFMKPGVMELSPRRAELLARMQKEEATAEEKKEFQAMQLKRCREILEGAFDNLFGIQMVRLSLPRKARMEPSRICASCGEPTMGSKLENLEGKEICRGCLELQKSETK
jgi:formylmethanofuran dehydrogenase subunit E